jgi:hypothetical protein
VVFAILFKWAQTGDPFQVSTLLLGTVVFILLMLGLQLGDKYFPYFLNGLSVNQLKRRIVPILLLFFIIILVVSLIIIALSTYVLYLIMGLDTGEFMHNLIHLDFPKVIKYYLISVLLVSPWFFYNFWRETADAEQQLREENLKYQYRTLKAQVNPHFLFNSLNTLSELVYVDAKRADKYIQELSGIYRYILDNEETDLIPLEKEIEFVKRYFDLQKERDGNKIELNIDILYAVPFKIVPVSLQLLLENAFKHNSASENTPLKIQIQNESEYVVVANNIQRKNVLKDSFGTGLPNLKKRIQLITGKEMIVTQENNKFIVKLPIVHIKDESINNRR